MTEQQLKQHFMNILFQVKRIDICNNVDMKLPYTELVVLNRLFSDDCIDGNSMCMSDIQSNLYISKPAVSQILNSLERKGYINRYIDTRDRRKIIVTATPAAHEVLKKSQTALDTKMDRILMEFGEENMTKLINQLAKLYEIYEKIESEDY